MNKLKLTVGATLAAVAAATAGTLPTDYGNPAEDIASGAVAGVTWSGAARAYKIGKDTVLVFTNTTEGACSVAIEQGKKATADCLLVGGGGPGGNGGSSFAGAGGGAGGFVELKGLTFEGNLAVTVGKGGEPVASGTQACNADGRPSLLVRDREELARALGGGGGGHFQGGDWKFSCGNPYASCWVSGTEYDYSKSTVASGGGGGYSSSWGVTYAQYGGLVRNDQGNSGGDTWEKIDQGGENWRSPGGGGGAGTAAKVPTDARIGGGGGDGRQSDITGERIAYAGGGAGGCGCKGREAKSVAGGLGGGGSASWDTTGDVQAIGVSESGVDSLGGGGAGSSATQEGPFAGASTAAGRGGNGVVVIRITEISAGEGPLEGVKFSGEAEWYNIGTGNTRETVIVYTNVNAAGSLTLSSGATARFLLVGGGGAGGRGSNEKEVGGGGGAGGMVTSDRTELSRGTYTITVGAGGVPSTNPGTKSGNGRDSAVSLGQVDLFRAVGGGAGGNPAQTAELAKGMAGGSGGGGAVYNDNGFIGQVGGSGTPNQGNEGSAANTPVNGGAYSNAGGGGGAGSAGHPPIATDPEWRGGAGGDGLPCDIIGVETWYAGGGAGGTKGYYESKTVSGGKGGGGTSATTADGFGRSESGVDGLGGGGAGMSSGPFPWTVVGPGRGGNGVVIVRITKVSSLGFSVIVR